MAVGECEYNIFEPKKAVGEMIPVLLATKMVDPDSRNGAVKSTAASRSAFIFNEVKTISNCLSTNADMRPFHFPFWNDRNKDMAMGHEAFWNVIKTWDLCKKRSSFQTLNTPHLVSKWYWIKTWDLRKKKFHQTLNTPHLVSLTRMRSYSNWRSSPNLASRSMQNPEQHWFW